MRVKVNRLRASVDFTDESKHESPDSRVGASKRTIGLQKMPVHPHRIGEDHGRLAGAPELPPCAVNLITPIGPARLRKLLWVDVTRARRAGMHLATSVGSRRQLATCAAGHLRDCGVPRGFQKWVVC